MPRDIRIKRAYDPPARSDGVRVLVDRLWPRGVSKEGGKIDHWAKALAPSAELRKWFNHDPAKFDAFARRYRAELDSKGDQIDELLERIGDRRATLVYAARDVAHNGAVVLRDRLREVQ